METNREIDRRFLSLILKERAAYFHQATLDERELLKPYIDTQKLERFWQEYLTAGDETHAESIWSGIISSRSLSSKGVAGRGFRSRRELTGG